MIIMHSTENENNAYRPVVTTQPNSSDVGECQISLLLTNTQKLKFENMSRSPNNSFELELNEDQVNYIKNQIQLDYESTGNSNACLIKIENKLKGPCEFYVSMKEKYPNTTSVVKTLACGATSCLCTGCAVEICSTLIFHPASEALHHYTGLHDVIENLGHGH